MSTFKRFEDIEVWQLARQTDKLIFSYTLKSGLEKDYKLKDQMRGSSGSIMDNIAEGFERDGNKEFVQFLSVSKGSSGELRSQLYRALDRQYINQEEFNIAYQEVIKISVMLKSLINYLKESDMKGIKFKKFKNGG